MAHNTQRSRYHGAALAISGLLLVPVLAPAGQGSLIALKMKFNPGETSKYQTTMQMNIEMPMMQQAGGMKMDMSMVQVQKVVKAQPNGGGDIQITTTDTRMNMNGQPMNSPASPPVTLTYDSQGNPKSVKGLPKDAPGGAVLGNMFNAGSMQMQGAFLPAKAVKPGDTWMQTVKMPGITSSAKVKGKFIKLEKIGRYRTAKIRTTLTGPMNLLMDAQGQPTNSAKQATMKMSGTMKMTTDTNFAISEGKMIRQAGSGTINLTMLPLGGAASKGASPANNMKMNMKMSLGSNLIE